MSPFDKKPTDLESDLQGDILDFAQMRGWFAVKVVSPSRRGMMDIYALRKGRHVWIEAKREGEDARAQQIRIAREMKAQGAEVYVADTLDRAREILR